MPHQSHRILLVDDNPGVSNAFKVLLEVKGHEVSILHAGSETLALIREWSPDVVFLDIAMPGMDGYEVAAAIHAAELAPRPLLIALTGYGQDSHGKAIADAGFDHHLLKPADPKQIEALLERLDREPESD
jgi:CheY-like chemotaxis protein